MHSPRMSQGLTLLSRESITKIPMHFRKNRWETSLGKWELSHFHFRFTFCPLLKILASEQKAFLMTWNTEIFILSQLY